MRTYMTVLPANLVFAASFHGSTIGGSDWDRDESKARARYKGMLGDADYDTDDLRLFTLMVPDIATSDQITELVDSAANGEDEGYHMTTLDKRSAKVEPPAPTFCPYCGGKDVVFVNTWTASSGEPHDPSNVADLDEHQCRTCDNRSFWS